MANMMEQVREFMIAFNQVVGEDIGFRDELLRIRLIGEESGETQQAIYAHDMTKAVDGLCDQMYVILGTFVTFGFTPEQVCKLFDEVHRSNMAKVGGKLDIFGKVQKPLGWTPPNIEQMLEEMTCEWYLEIITDGNIIESCSYSLDYCKDMIVYFRENADLIPKVFDVCIKRRMKQKE